MSHSSPTIDPVHPPAYLDQVPPSVIMVPLIWLFLALFLFLSLLFAHLGLAVFAFLVLSLIVFVKIWAGYGLAGLHCDSTIDKARLFPDELLTDTLVIENRRWLPVALDIEPPEEAGFEVSSHSDDIIGRFGLLGYQRCRLQRTLKATRRGVFYLTTPGLTVGDFFGFCMLMKKSEICSEVVVYPRIRPLPPLDLPGREFFGHLGCRSPVQDPVYILGTRDYHHRQPARFIHWKASARHQRLQEKIFEPTRQEKILLVVDTDDFSGDHEALFERMLETVASLAVKLEGLGYAVGLLANSGWAEQTSLHVPVSRSPRQQSLILEALARLEARPLTMMPDILLDSVRLTWGISVLHFSYAINEQAKRVEAYFIMKKIPAFFVVATKPNGIGPAGEDELLSGTVLMDDLMISTSGCPGTMPVGNTCVEVGV